MKNVLVRYLKYSRHKKFIGFQSECKRGCPCPEHPFEDPFELPFECRDVPTTPAPVTTTTAQATTTAVTSTVGLNTTSWWNSTTPIDIYDWRQIMGDKFNTLQILAITELVFAFIIFVFGH